MTGVSKSLSSSLVVPLLCHGLALGVTFPFHVSRLVYINLNKITIRPNYNLNLTVFFPNSSLSLTPQNSRELSIITNAR